MIAYLMRERLMTFGLVLAIGFLLIVSLAVNTWIAALGAFSAQHLKSFEGLLQVVNSPVSFVVITGLFAAIYKILPEVRIEWEDVMLGSIVTSLLFTAGKFLIGLYLEKQPLPPRMGLRLPWSFSSSGFTTPPKSFSSEIRPRIDRENEHQQVSLTFEVFSCKRARLTTPTISGDTKLPPETYTPDFALTSRKKNHAKKSGN